MKLTVANANISNTLSTASITLGNTNIINSVSIGNVSITSAEIDVGNVVITPIAVFVPTLVLGGTQFAGGGLLQGGIINYQEFTANGTWNNPYANASVNASLTGYEQVLVMAWGGGGGSNTSDGGGGGACVIGNYNCAQLANTCNVVVGNGGSGGPSATSGENSSFAGISGTLLTAYGGGRGLGSVGAGSGGGWLSAGSTTTGATGGAGGAPLGGAGANNTTQVGGVSTFGGGGGGWSTVNAGSSVYGGGGGVWSAVAGNSIFGGAGGSSQGAGGISVFGGAGGNSVFANGSIPGGGGSNNGRGGRGEVRVWVFGPGTTTLGPPAYALIANTTSIYGGDSILYTVSTANIPNGTTLYYTLNNSSSAVSTDFSTAVNGSIIINAGVGTFSLSSNNRSYSSNTGMTFDIRTDSTTGPIVASNNTVVIRKTPTITYLGDYSQETGLGADSTVTLTSQTLGTANTTRRIVVAVARYRNDSSLTPTVTVAGITATRLVGWAGNYNTTNIYIADVPTGTTGNIVVTNAVDHYNGVTITWYALYDLGSSAAVSSAEAHGSVFNRSLTLNTLNQSIVIFKSSRYASNSPTSITVDGTAGLTTVDADVRYDTVYYFYGTAGSKNMVPEGALTVRINVGTKSEIGASAIAIR